MASCGAAAGRSWWTAVTDDVTASDMAQHSTSVACARGRGCPSAWRAGASRARFRRAARRGLAVRRPGRSGRCGPRRTVGVVRRRPSALMAVVVVLGATAVVGVSRRCADRDVRLECHEAVRHLIRTQPPLADRRCGRRRPDCGRRTPESGRLLGAAAATVVDRLTALICLFAVAWVAYAVDRRGRP